MERMLRVWLERSRPAHDILLLTGLALLLLGAGMGLRDPWPADEPRFALIARDMVRSGQWLIPRIGGEWYSDKPPLFMWIVAALYAVTGHLRIAFLLPSLLSGLGMLLLVRDLAQRLWDRDTALLAALLLLFTVQFTLQSRSAQLDAMVSLFTTLGIYGLIRHLLLGPDWRWYYLAWISMGLGIITKGVGFLPLLMLLPWAVLRRLNPEALPEVGGSAVRWWTGPILMLLMIATWLIPMLVYVSTSGLPELVDYRDDILLRQTAERYVDSWVHVKAPWYYVVAVIPWAWFPLSLMLPWLVPQWWRRLRSADAATCLLVGWVVCVLVFFSASPGKRGVYLLPALPALILAAAPLLPSLLARKSVQTALRGGLLVIAVALTTLPLWLWLFAPAQVDRLTQAAGFHPGILLWLLAAWSLLALVASRWTTGLAAYLLLMSGIWQIHGWYAAPQLNAARSGIMLMRTTESLLAPEHQLAVAGWREQLLLQATRPIIHFGFRRETAEETADALAWLATSERHRLLMPADQLPPCLDNSAAIHVAFSHRRDWMLVGSNALTADCEPGTWPAEAWLYHPESGSGAPDGRWTPPQQVSGARSLPRLITASDSQ